MCVCEYVSTTTGHVRHDTGGNTPAKHAMGEESYCPRREILQKKFRVISNLKMQQKKYCIIKIGTNASKENLRNKKKYCVLSMTAPE